MTSRIDIATQLNFTISRLHEYTIEQLEAAKSILKKIKQGQQLLLLPKPYTGNFTGNTNRHPRENAQKWFKAWFEKDATADLFTKRVRSLDFRTVCFNCHILPSTVALIPDVVWPYTRRALLDQIKSTLSSSFRDNVCHTVLRGESIARREEFALSFNMVFGADAVIKAEVKAEVKDEAKELTKLLTEAADGADTKRAKYKKAAAEEKKLLDTDFNKRLLEIVKQDGGLKNQLEYTKLIEEFEKQRRKENGELETRYKEQLEAAARLDTQYNIHPDRAQLLNSELIGLVEELSKLKLGFEETALYQLEINKMFEGIPIPESATLISSGS
jgi:hypothetical protein